MPVLDRRIEFDPRSRAFPISAVLPDKPLRSYTWRHVQLDQGQEGACVGFAVTMEAAARPKPFFGDPVRQPPDPIVINGIARQNYLAAQYEDRFEDTPPAEGTSVLAGMKIGKKVGYWDEYRWSLGPGGAAAARDVALSILSGPVVMGSWWWTGMFQADGNGYLNLTGQREGGHAWLITSYNVKRNAFWTPNSWGGAGQGWIRFDDLAALLSDNGEAAIPTIRKI